jgi:hypothetical protein
MNLRMMENALSLFLGRNLLQNCRNNGIKCIHQVENLLDKVLPSHQKGYNL